MLGRLAAVVAVIVVYAADALTPPDIFLSAVYLALIGGVSLLRRRVFLVAWSVAAILATLACGFTASPDSVTVVMLNRLMISTGLVVSTIILLLRMTRAESRQAYGRLGR